MSGVFELDTIELDLPALAGAFGRRLHDAGVAVTAERSAAFAASLKLVRPVSRRRLYWTARSVFVSDRAEAKLFNRVFAEVFGTGRTAEDPDVSLDADLVATPPDDRELDAEQRREREASRTSRRGDELASASPLGRDRDPDDDADADAEEIAVPALSSDEELLRSKRFDALTPEELVELYRLMLRMRVATPKRRARRTRGDRHGDRIDLRRTLRGSLRTGGDPIRLSRRSRRVERRRIVLLCDISGSMEPYARAYLQFLTCAAGTGDGHEAFVFATRLTRVTRALASRNPERAIQRAAAAAPDWSSGTRIGEALKRFNDVHGRRGMARGAVVVILSDGWERGDPALVGREMQRLRRLAYRVVWVNPRVAAAGFSPRAGGMAAALPHCDALVSGHTLGALEQVVEAIAAARDDDLGVAGAGWRVASPEPETVAEDEPWASAKPVPGSSVAMPSGYGPSRGKTTPGWSIGR